MSGAAAPAVPWVAIIMPVATTTILGIIGWLFRQWARGISSKVDGISKQVEDLDGKVDQGLQRTSRIEGHLGLNGGGPNPGAWWNRGGRR